MTSIEEYINSTGTILSGQLAQYLVKSFNISEDAARKRIERLSSPIHKLKGFFTDNQSFIYHKSDFNSELFYEKLSDAFNISGKRYASIITAINYHHGFILKKDLPNYSFSPINNIKGHINFASLTEKMIKNKLLFDYDENYYQLNTFLYDKQNINFRYYKAVEFSKNLLINNFENWAKKLGLFSYNSGKSNEIVGGFQFAFTAPSYISGLIQYNKGKIKPGFVVADILIKNSIYIHQIEFFIQKIKILKNSNSHVRLFPILIIEEIDSKALNELKKNGVMIAFIREIFGNKYIELLNALINTITNASIILKKDPDKYIDLMTQLTKLVEGKTYNLRGDLFELAVGFYYGQTCKFLEIGKKCLINGESKIVEVDVFATYVDKIVLVECKGYHYSIDKDYILKYLNEKVPFLKRYLDTSTFKQDKYVFEIWSTGGFTPEATELLEKAKNFTKKYSIDYLSKDDILKRAKSPKTSKLIKILKEYYLKEIS